MRLRNCHADRPEFASIATEAPCSRNLRQALKHMLRQVFGGRVRAVEVCHLVEISIVDGLENRLQRLVSAANIDDDSVGVESVGKESCINHKGRAVERLGRAENASTKRVGDHDMVANFNGEQCHTSRSQATLSGSG